MTPINSLQHLLALSNQLEQQSKNHPVTDVFIKSSKLGNKFEPRKTGIFARIGQDIERLIFSKKYDLAKNLRQVESFFRDVQNVSPSEFGTIQAKNQADIEDKVNGLAANLDKIRDQAIKILTERAGKESSPKKREALQAKINELKNITFQQVDVEKKLESRLRDELKSHVDEKTLLNTPSARNLNTFVNSLHAQLGQGVRIKSLAQIKADFASAVKAKRAEYLTRFEEALDQPDPQLLDTLCSEPDRERRDAILTIAFTERAEAVFPTGFVDYERSAHLDAFIQKFDNERAVVVQQKIDDFAAKLDAEVGVLFKRMPTRNLDEIMQEFNSFVEKNAPPGISPEEFKNVCGLRILQLEERASQELERRARDAVEKVKKEVDETQALTDIDPETKKQAYSILRQLIRDSDHLDAKKEEALKELTALENKIKQLEAQEKTIAVTNPSAPFQIGNGNTINITNITNCPTPLAEKVSGVANSYLRDSIMRAAAYIVMQIVLAGTASALSWPFMLSLIAPHIATYVTNRICEQLPASVASWVKPFGVTLGTLGLVRCAIPYVGQMGAQVLKAVTPSAPIVSTPLEISEPFTGSPSFAQSAAAEFQVPDNATVSDSFSVVSTAILNPAAAMPVFGPSPFAVLTPAMNATEEVQTPMPQLDMLPSPMPVNVSDVQHTEPSFTSLYGLRSNQILLGRSLEATGIPLKEDMQQQASVEAQKLMPSPTSTSGSTAESKSWMAWAVRLVKRVASVHAKTENPIAKLTDVSRSRQSGNQNAQAPENAQIQEQIAVDPAKRRGGV